MKNLMNKSRVIFLADILIDVTALAYLFWYDWKLALAILALVIGTRGRIALISIEVKNDFDKILNNLKLIRKEFYNDNLNEN